MSHKATVSRDKAVFIQTVCWACFEKGSHFVAEVLAWNLPALAMTCMRHHAQLANSFSLAIIVDQVLFTMSLILILVILLSMIYFELVVIQSIRFFFSN